MAKQHSNKRSFFITGPHVLALALCLSLLALAVPVHADLSDILDMTPNYIPVLIGGIFKNSPFYATGEGLGQNVGLGTESPDAKLTVNGDVHATGNTVVESELSFGSATATGEIDMNQKAIRNVPYPNAGSEDSDAVPKSYVLAQLETLGGTSLPSGTAGQTLRHDGTGWVANSLLYNDGTSIGVGTTSPTTKLEVAGPIRVQGSNVQITRPSTTGGYARGITFMDDSMSATEAGIGMLGSGDTPPHTLYMAHGASPWSSGTGIYVKDTGNVGVGTASPATKLEVAGQVKITGGSPGAGKVLTSDATGLASWVTPASSGDSIPKGVIVMWSGSVASIPAGWALCDGSQGTPDLRSRFIMGAPAGQNPGQTGGASSYSLTAAQLPSHTHTATTASTGAHTHTVNPSTASTVSTSTAGEHSHQLWNPQTMIGAQTASSSYYALLNWGWSSGVISTEGAHSHTVTIPSHTHSSSSAGAHTHTVTVGSTGSGAAIDNRPAYYTLAFIMKL